MNLPRLLAILLLVLAGGGATGCQAADDAAFTTADTVALRAALAANLDAANDGDPAGWAALYTEDAPHPCTRQGCH